MNKKKSLALLMLIGGLGLFLAQPWEVAISPPTRVDDFRLIDQFGRAHALQYLSDQDEAVYVAVSLDCGTDAAVAAMRRSQAARSAAPHFYVHAGPGQRRTAFQAPFQSTGTHAPIFLGTTTKSEPSSFQALLQSTDPHVPVLMDSSRTISASLALSNVAAVVSVDPSSGALTVIDAGDSDCPLPPHDGSALTYEDDIIPIIGDHCLECHSTQRSVRLWTDLGTVTGWSAMIRQTLRTRLMPPGGHDSHYGNVEGGYEQGDMDKLLQWIEAGMPSKGGEDPLPAMNAAITQEANSVTDWGEPDTVWAMTEPHHLPASGPDQYLYAQVGGPTKRDIWVNRIQLKLNRRAVHHANLLVLDTPLAHLGPDDFEHGDDMIDVRIRKVKEGKENMYKPPEEGSTLRVAHHLFEETTMFTYGRSKPTLEFDPGQATLVPKGSYIVLEFHYGLTGKKEENLAQVLVHEHDPAAPLTAVERGTLYRGSFKIPPHKKRFTMKTAVDLEEDILLLEMVPHMHRRGHSVKYVAIHPDGRKEVLLSIPHFQYKYQPQWKLTEPIALKAGTRLVTLMTYDNSAQNPINPDPEAWVTNGSQRIQEMHLPRFYYVKVGASQEGE
jgi:hypothetical protein